MSAKNKDEALKELKKEFPSKFENATALGAGKFGLAVDNHDGTVSKIFFKHATPNENYSTNNEVLFLQRFDRGSIVEIQTPVLIGEPEPLESEHFSGMYRMTKISGNGANWHEMIEKENPENLSSHFYKAGAALAQFHAAAATTNPEGLIEFGEEQGGSISQIAGIDSATNDALNAANRYLQTHKKSAIIHGDFHGHNILLNDKGNVTGIIDFGLTGQSDNYLTDFRNVPDETLPDFIAGYEQASGQKIDPDMITMTKLSMFSDLTNYYWNDPEQRSKNIAELKEHLAKVGHITGYTP